MKVDNEIVAIVVHETTCESKCWVTQNNEPHRLDALATLVYEETFMNLHSSKL